MKERKWIFDLPISLLTTGIILLFIFNLSSCSNQFIQDEMTTGGEGIELSRGVLSGDEITIYSETSGAYVAVDSYEKLYASTTTVGNSVKFVVEDAGSGYIALKSVINNKYVNIVDSYSILNASSTAIGTNEKFRLDTRNDGYTAIYSLALNTYVNVNPNESDAVKAQWNDKEGGWQQLSIVSVNSSLIIGVDLSEALYAQNMGVDYKDQNGISKDVFQIFEENGYTWVRVRVNVDPDNTDYAMFTDLEYAKTLGSIAKNYGFKLLVDFHYSKWWADPENQWTPTSWLTTDVNILSSTVYNWTKDAMTQLINAGAAPDMVQIGNEINSGLLWDLGGVYHGGSWDNVASFINSGIDGVRDAGSSAEIMLHTATGGSWSGTNNWINNFKDAGGNWDQVDAFGLSYYSMWHGTVDDLSDNLWNLGNSYPTKDIYIVETAYYWDTNQAGNTGSAVPYPQTEEGQYNFLQSVKAAAVANNIKGVYYWGAAWAQSEKWLVATDWDDDDASRRSVFDDSGTATMGIRGLID